MKMTKVKSSNLQAIGYDKSTRTLRILFQAGPDSYDYEQVPEEVYGALMKAASLGQFFQEHIREQYRYTKANLREEGNDMGQNKSQKAAARAQAAAPNAAQPTVQPQPQPAATTATATVTAAPAPPSKQDATLTKLREGWTAKGVDLSRMTIRDDGKFKLIVVAEGWPTVQIGASGGITVLELKSYAKAFDAAIDGLALYQKQQAREAKKAAPAPAATPAPAPAVKETVTAKKGKQHAAVEQQLAQQSA